MSFTRREFLETSAGLCAAALLPSISLGERDINYAVVVSEDTFNDPAWGKVVSALVEKYPGTAVHRHTGDMHEVKEALGEQRPSHAALVARPEELLIPKLAREAGISVNSWDTLRQSNKIETEAVLQSGIGQFNTILYSETGYYSAISGIITGLEAQDAQRLAEAEPFVINNGIAKASPVEWISALPNGVGFSESQATAEDGRKYVVRFERADGEVVRGETELAGPEILERLNSGEVNAVFTSAHANHNVWDMGWKDARTNYIDDMMAARDGNVVIYDMTSGSPVLRGVVEADNPKAFVSVGSCQTARIKTPEASLALALMRSNGVTQYFGYANDTWHGHGGWGMQGELLENADSPTLFEALHRTRLSLKYGAELMRQAREAGGFGEIQFPRDKMEVGHEYDHLSFVGYGDPALDVRLELADGFKPLFERSVSKNGDTYRLQLRATRDEPGSQNFPVFMLPGNIGTPRDIQTSDNLTNYKIIDNAVVFGVGRAVSTTEQGVSYKQSPVGKDETWTLEFSA